MALHKLKSVKAKDNFRIHVSFFDGTQWEVDLSHLAGKWVFSIRNTSGTFDKVYIDKESWAIARNDQLDICPDSIYQQISSS